MGKNDTPSHLLEKLSLKTLSELLNCQKFPVTVHLFTDYDGTLAPFQADPSQAYPLPGTGRLLLDLNAFQNIAVTVITGREPEDVRELLASREIPVAGLHGLIYLASDSDKREFLGKADLTLPREVKKRIRQIAEEYPGVKLENKGELLALHWAPGSLFSPDKIREELEEMLAGAGWEVLQGRQVLEVRPAGWHKGKAVDFLRRRLAGSNSGQEVAAVQHEIPAIYLGDDATDEDVFQSFTGPGFTVYIKNDDKLETAADYYLEDPSEVRKFLERFRQTIKQEMNPRN